MDMIARQIQAPATQDNASHNMPDHTDACTSLQRVVVLEIHITSDDQNLTQEQIPNWSASTPGLPAEDTDCPPHPMSRFRWWIVLNMKTYLIIPHNRDAVANEIKSGALHHELDELNTGNALADRSSFGLQLCDSIQAMPWKSAALLEYTFQKSEEIRVLWYQLLWTTHFESFKKYEFFHMEFISLNIENFRPSKCTVNICFWICFAQA